MVPSDKMRTPLASPCTTPGMFEVTLPPVPVSEMLPPWLLIVCGVLPEALMPYCRLVEKAPPDKTLLPPMPVIAMLPVVV